jgi:CheY-like chemotaxis protein
MSAQFSFTAPSASMPGASRGQAPANAPLNAPQTGHASLAPLTSISRRSEADAEFFSEAGYSSDQFDESETQPSAFEFNPPEPGLVPALIVDADREVRYYLRAKLAMAGMLHADEAASGSEALYLLKTRRYELVLMDVDLPDIDGWDLAARVAATRQRPALARSLVLTGHNMSWLGTLRGRLAGARNCIKKPLHPIELAVLLRTLNGR